MPMKFRFAWIPFIAAVLIVSIGVALGQWQTRRAVEKETIEAKLSQRALAPLLVLDETRHRPEDVEYRRVKLRGQFVRDWPVYLDNRPYKGRAGFHVLMPLKIAGTDMHVLVMRGWAPRNVSDRTSMPAIDTPEDAVEIEGIARSGTGQVLQLGEAAPLEPRAVVQNADVSAFERAGKWRMHDFVIQQSTDLQDGLIRDWPRPSMGVDKHRGYAFQWYALAATALIFFVVTGFRRGSK